MGGLEIFGELIAAFGRVLTGRRVGDLCQQLPRFGLHAFRQLNTFRRR